MFRNVGVLLPHEKFLKRDSKIFLVYDGVNIFDYLSLCMRGTEWILRPFHVIRCSI